MLKGKQVMHIYYLVKAINPMTDYFTPEYNIYGCFTNKMQAQQEKRHLQSLGFRKVCIKRNINQCLYYPTKEK